MPAQSALCKNPDITVEQLLAEKKAKVVQYARYQVGEGIEKSRKTLWKK